MNKLKIIKKKNNKIIWNKIRNYIIFWILACCSVIIFNIHPTETSNNSNNIENNKEIMYIFHDYAWNKYILNNTSHWSSDSLDFLFDKEVPNEIKWDENQHYSSEVSLANNWKNINNWDSDNGWDIKDNQVSLESIMSDLWIDWTDNNNDYLVISLWNNDNNNDNTQYKIKEEAYEWDNSTLIIERENYDNDKIDSEETNNKIEDLLNAKRFEYTKEGRVLPSLVKWDEIQLYNKSKTIIAYTDSNYNNNNESKESSNKWITIIDNYAECYTPRWYSIEHWDSVLAYKQLENAPDICNIERRYCWNGKLSWTYTQQWCSVNKNYTYNSRWEAEIPQKQEQEEIKWWARQNPDWSTTVKSNEIWWAFVFDRPNRSKTDFISGDNDNIIHESEWIEQTTRPYRDCTTPRWEKVRHGQYIYAYKHSNWFSDSPCEVQLRLCSMWELFWTYKESRCKTRDTSFIDWINWSPTRDTYSKEKLDFIKKQLKDEEKNYKNERKNATRSIDSNALDKILLILDK